MNTNSRHVGRYQIPAIEGESPEVSARLRAELQPWDTAMLLRVRGDIDAYTLARWHRLLDEAFLRAAATRHLIVEVSEVSFMSCRAILDLAGRAQQHHDTTRVSVVNAVPSVVDRIIAAAGLTEWLELHSELAEAIRTQTPPRPSMQ